MRPHEEEKFNIIMASKYQRGCLSVLRTSKLRVESAQHWILLSTLPRAERFDGLQADWTLAFITGSKLQNICLAKSW